MLSLQRTLSVGYLAQHPTRMVLIVVSIALGVATLVATRCLDDSLHQAAKGAINPFATLADLLVSNGQTGVPADLADRLKDAHLAGLGDVQPLVMGRAVLVELDDQSVRLLGVNWSPDLLPKQGETPSKDNPWGLEIQAASLDEQAAAWQAVVFSGAKPVLVGAPLAERLQATPTGASRFHLRRGPGDVQEMATFGTVHLKGAAHVLEDEGLFTDVATAASIIYPQRKDYCTQLNLKLAPGGDREQVRKEVDQFLKDRNEPGQVQTIEANEEMATDVTAGLELGFSVGGYLALMVGMFLVYNALSVSVAERRRDIGILRSVGATRVQIGGLFVGEAAVQGLCGSLLGLPLGYGLAWLALRPMQNVLSEVFVKLPETTISVSVPVMLLALARAWRPRCWPRYSPRCRRPTSSRPTPFAVRRRRSGRSTRPCKPALPSPWLRREQRRRCSASTCRRGVGSFVAPICLMGACEVAMPLLAGAVGRLVQPIFRYLLGLEGRLAADNLVRSPGRTGVVIAALATTGALLLQTAGFTYSTEQAINGWLDDNIAADLYVTAGSGISKAGFSLPMDASVGDELTPGPGRVPPVDGVDAVLPVRFHYFTYKGQFVYLLAVGSDALHGEASDRALGGSLRKFPRFRQPHTCVVSENFAALHHVSVGDHITVPGRSTPTIDLEVLGSIVDYSSNRGTLLVDRDWYAKEFLDNQVDVFDVYLRPGVDGKQVQTELMKPGGWASKQAVFVERRDELRDAVTNQLERIYHLAYAQEFVVGVVALLGVASALFISVLQRRRELGLLRAVGASQGQVLRSVLAEAALMGMVGSIIGVCMGLLLEWYTVKIMVFDEAGFIFPMMAPWTSMIVVFGGSVLTATLVGLWPAWFATRLRIPEAIAYE